MSATALNLQRYGRLLTKVLPLVIESEEENERMLAEVRKLMAKGEHLSPEEDKLLKLMVRLIEDYEERAYPLKKANPHQALREFMRARGLRQRDLWKVFGSRRDYLGGSPGQAGNQQDTGQAVGGVFPRLASAVPVTG